MIRMDTATGIISVNTELQALKHKVRISRGKSGVQIEYGDEAMNPSSVAPVLTLGLIVGWGRQIWNSLTQVG